MIYTVTLNPALDKTVQIPNFTLDAVNRITELRRDAGGKGINVSKVIAKLGGTSEAVAVLSGDTGIPIESPPHQSRGHPFLCPHPLPILLLPPSPSAEPASTPENTGKTEKK